jgi:hypothetical protein
LPLKRQQLVPIGIMDPLPPFGLDLILQGSFKIGSGGSRSVLPDRLPDQCKRFFVAHLSLKQKGLAEQSLASFSIQRAARGGKQLFKYRILWRTVFEQNYSFFFSPLAHQCFCPGSDAVQFQF